VFSNHCRRPPLARNRKQWDTRPNRESQKEDPDGEAGAAPALAGWSLEPERNRAIASSHSVKGVRGHHPMTNPKRGFALLVLAVMAVSLIAAFLLLRRREIHVYDGFESGRLGAQWSRSRMVPGSFRAQSEIVRAGHSAGEITIHSRDRREEASDDGNATERDELMEAWWLVAHIGRAYRYSLSLYLPADFPSCRSGW
jgi:hypothetical protein